MSEAKLQRAIQRQLRVDHGCFPIKIHGNRFQMAGIPDLIVAVPFPFSDAAQIDIGDPMLKKAVAWRARYGSGPHYVWLEVKLPGEKLSKNQIRLHKEMRKFGMDVRVVESVEEAVEVVNGIRQGG